MYIRGYMYILESYLYALFLLTGVIKIKRKIVLHGPSTLTISLPSSWVKKFNVKKGDEVELNEQGRELVISSESTKFEEKKIDIGKLGRVGRSYITSSYRQGYDEIDFAYSQGHYLETIQELISKEITGFEVVRHQNNHCIIKDLTGHSKDEFSTALRRVWLLLLDLSIESLEVIKKNNSSELKNIKMIDYSINKFTNYCLRILIKKGRYDYKKTPPYYHLVKRLEEIADQYKELCKFHSMNPKNYNDNMVEMFEKTNRHLNDVYELFYKYDDDKIEEMYNATKETYDELSKINNRVAFYLYFVCKDIRNLLSLLIEINI